MTSQRLFNTFAKLLYLYLVRFWRVQASWSSFLRDAIYECLSWSITSTTTTTPPPPTASRPIVSLRWLTQVLKAPVISIQELPLDENNRGFVGNIRILQVEVSYIPTESPQDVSLVLKTSLPRKSSRLVGFGSIREGLFYKSKYARYLMELGRIPKIYYSYGSLWMGDMILLMENLSSLGSESGFLTVGVNQCMGNQIWKTDPSTPQTMDRIEIVRAMFYWNAELHAKYWMDTTLLQETWMRNTRWYHGSGRIAWELSMEASLQGWRKLWSDTTTTTTGKSIHFPDHFVPIVELSFRISTWTHLQDHLRHSPFTLTHGDFHAANIILNLPQNRASYPAQDILEGMKVLDWSEVGPWEPTTDLAQTIISDLPIMLLNQVEDCLKGYYARLVNLGVENYSWEECRRRFGESGMERWIWILGILSSLFDITTSGLGQYFIDQMNAFRLEFCPNHTHFLLKSASSILPP
jgi:hypothetical protein